MDNIILFNQNNQSFNANVIRYFTLNNKNYFIFSLNEIDEQGYVQLYVVNVIEDIDGAQAKNLTKEEWPDVRKQIEQIVFNNRNNTINQNDRFFEKLNGMIVNDSKIIRLKKETALELSQNKNPQPQATEVTQKQPEIAQVVSEDNYTQFVGTIQSNSQNNQINQQEQIDYKAKYEQTQYEIQNLREENLKIREELSILKDKIEKVKKELQ